MMMPGWVEVVILFFIGMVTLILPLGAIVFLAFVYRKLNRIEKLLKQRDTLP
jgi:hypothetical protein